MKQLLLIFLLLIFGFQSKAQVTTWCRAHGTQFHDYIKEIKVANDGHYIASGHSINPDTNLLADFYVIKVDSSNGELIWQTYVSAAESQKLVAMDISSNGEIILVGSNDAKDVSYWGNNGDQVAVAKLASNGKLIWNKIIAIPDTQYCHDAICLPDGSIAIVGLNRNAAGVFSNFFMKLDSAGDFQFIKLYGSTPSDRFSHIINTNDSLIAVFGNTNSNSQFVKFWFLKFDLNGDTIFANNSYFGSDGVFTQMKNDTYVVNGRVSLGSNVAILNFDSSFSLTGSNNYSSYSNYPKSISASKITNKVIVSNYQYSGKYYVFKDTASQMVIDKQFYIFNDQTLFYLLQGNAPLSWYEIGNSQEGFVAAFEKSMNSSMGLDFIISKYDQNCNLNYSNSKPTVNVPAGDTLCLGDSVLLYITTNKKLYTNWISNDGKFYHKGDSFYVKSTGNYFAVCYDIDSNLILSEMRNIYFKDTVPSSSIKVNGPSEFCRLAGDSLFLSVDSNIYVQLQWQLNGIDIPGATKKVYKVLATGNYRCAFIYSCDTIFSAPVFINDSTPPNVSLNSSIGTYYPYCNNKMFPQLSATSSTKNTLFKWYNNGILIDSSQSQYLNPSYGNDSIWHVVAVTACGTDTSLYAYYSLEPQQQTLACGMANDTAILCFNDSIEFCTGGTYWYLNGIYTNNVTLPLYISKPGTYKYEYTTGNCTTWSLPIYVIDKMNDSLKIKISPNDTVCNKKVTLNVMSPQANVLYTWYRNGLFFSTNDTVITGVSGNFHCEAFINGCDTLYSDTVYIQTDSVPAEIFKLNNFTNLCDADSIFLFDYNFDTNYVYAWKRVGNSFVYSNTYFYRPLAVGNYYFTKSSKTCVVISDTVQITSNNSNLNATITTTPSACSPCNGSATITANNPTNFNYLWSNSQTNQTAYNFCGGTYTVTVSVPGCSKSFNFMLGNSTPVSAIATTTTPSFGICDGTIAFNIIGGFAPYQTSLIPSAPLTALCQDVNYKATLTDNKGCTFVIDSAFYYKLSYDTIWPGDADNNGFVDNYDVVPLLLQDGRTGATRVDTTIAWHPIFPAYDWNGTKLYNNINCKHIDTDGNGIINIKDTAAITLNYDVTGKKNYNLQLNPQGPELYVTANASQFMPGNQVVLNYYAGTQSNPFYILRAFAAQTFIPKEVIEPGTFNLSSQNNFLTNFSFGYFFVKSDTNFQIDVAFGNYKYGFPNVYGELFTISFDVASSLSQVVNFAPAINNYTAHVSNELQIACSQSITPLTFLPVGIYETHLQDNIIIYPHPAKNEVSISSSNDIIKAIKIYNSSSKNVFSANSNSNRFTIQTENFPNGYYQIQIQLGNGNYANKKLIIIH